MYNSIIKEYEEKITKIKEERDLNRERIKAANLKRPKMLYITISDTVSDLMFHKILRV